jgi:hypothetical protein
MPHTAQHPHNPCSLDENDQVPAKIWELLRHNDTFRADVQRLSKLDTEERNNRAKTGEHHGSAWVESWQLLESIKERHPFAGVALEWLVPDPLFEIHYKALPSNLDLTGKRSAPLVTVKLQQGSNPDPKDKEHWRTFEAQGEQDAESVANLNGRPWRRGPHVHLQLSTDPRFCDKVDPLQEWRDYFTAGRKFTVDTPWCDAPPQFKREFSFLWRQLDSRTKNRVTGTRIDAPYEHETDFFQSWHLTDFRASGSSNLSKDDLVKVLKFNQLADDYRVFAIPNTIRTRMEARRVADWLYDQLAANLPAREPELYGSPLQWDIFLTVRDLMHAGTPFDEALQESFEKIHLKADNWHEGQPMPDQKKGWAQRGTDWLNTYRMMDAPLAGSGFVQKIFSDKPDRSPPATSVSGS